MVLGLRRSIGRPNRFGIGDRIRLADAAQGCQRAKTTSPIQANRFGRASCSPVVCCVDHPGNRSSGCSSARISGRHSGRLAGRSSAGGWVVKASGLPDLAEVAVADFSAEAVPGLGSHHPVTGPLPHERETIMTEQPIRLDRTRRPRLRHPPPVRLPTHRIPGPALPHRPPPPLHLRRLRTATRRTHRRRPRRPAAHLVNAIDSSHAGTVIIALFTETPDRYKPWPAPSPTSCSRHRHHRPRDPGHHHYDHHQLPAPPSNTPTAPPPPPHQPGRCLHRSRRLRTANALHGRTVLPSRTDYIAAITPQPGHHHPSSNSPTPTPTPPALAPTPTPSPTRRPGTAAAILMTSAPRSPNRSLRRGRRGPG